MSDKERAAQAYDAVHAARRRLYDGDDASDTARSLDERAQALNTARRALASAYSGVIPFVSGEIARLAVHDASVALNNLASRDGA